MATDVIRPIRLRYFNAIGLTGDYKVLNVGGLPEACSYIKIFNDSDFVLDLSYDGQQGHEMLDPSDTLELYFQANSRSNNHVAMLNKGTKIYGKDGGAGLKGGYIYISGWYVK